MDHHDILPLAASQPLEVSALLVDVCGAVFDQSHWRRWLFQLLVKIGLHTNYVSFYRLWDQEFSPEIKCGRASFAETLQAFLVSAGLTAAQAAEVLIALRTRKRDFDQSICPLPGVARTLRQVGAQGVALAALVGSDEVERQIRRAGLAGCFHKVFRCGDLPRGPGAEARFRSAIAQWCRSEAEQVALVSQSAWELERAAAANLRTVAVNFDGAVDADAHLEHLGEITRLLTPPAPQRSLAG